MREKRNRDIIAVYNKVDSQSVIGESWRYQRETVSSDVCHYHNGVYCLHTVVTVVPMNAQDIPSHVRISVHPNSASSFDYRSNLYLFNLLAAYSEGISMNVSQSNFVGAETNFDLYASIVSEFKKFNVTNPEDIKLINSINLSKEDYRRLIDDAKQFATL